MGVDVFLKPPKKKDNELWLGRLGGISNLLADCREPGCIDDAIEQLEDELHDAKADIQTVVAYSPTGIEDLEKMNVRVDECLKDLIDLSGKLRMACLIKMAIEDGFELEITY